MSRRLFKSIFKKINLIIFFFKIKKNFKNIQSESKEVKTTYKKSILFEFYFSDLIILSLFLLLGLVNKKKNKIYFFYHSKNIFKKKIISIFLKYFAISIKKYLNINSINTYTKSKKNLEASMKIFKKLNVKEDVYNITYKNHKIGKYIYQSYCRDFMEYTVNINDRRLLTKIEDALNVLDNMNAFFKKNRVDKLLISHTVFIKYGLLTSLAKKYGSKIYIFWKQKNNLIKRLQISKSLVQADDYKNFKKIFNNQTDKKKLISFSKKKLNQTLSGRFDNLIRKNGKSSFDKNKIFLFKKSDKPKILILPSCFFDAVMFFEKSLFPDNYTWLEYLLTKSKETNFEWYLKPHPDGMLENFNVIKKFQKDFPHLNLIDKNISNYSFKRAKFSSMFTYQSNAILEFAHMNIPSVIVSDNLQSSFNYAKPVMCLKEFDQMILNADKLKLNKKNRQEIYQFSSVFYNFLSKKVKFYNDFAVSNESKNYVFDELNQISNYFKKEFYLEKKNKLKRFI
jgi:hypothetical protein